MGHEEKKHKDQEEQEEQYKQEKCDDQGEEQRRGIGVAVPSTHTLSTGSYPSVSCKDGSRYSISLPVD